MTINDNRTDILCRLDAMLVKEATSSARCVNYFRSCVGGGIDESCRLAMTTWLRQVQRQLDLSPDVVRIALSIFDRYLSSGRGGSDRALRNKSDFQLAAITAFYIAVKINEPVVLGIDMLLIVCRRAYTEDDFVSMEMDILSAINWSVSYHTAMDYARALLELICEDECLPPCVARDLLGVCERRMDDAIADIDLSCLSRSELGTRCAARSLAENEFLSPVEKEAIWIRLSESLIVDQSSMEGVASFQYLARRASSFKPKVIVSKLDSSSRQLSSADISTYSTAGSSSPICISCAARQA
ncbi:hypothetical protein ACHAXA_006264 [Cyclostephanos tholiformis]|uniref:Cyclin-like domain-containing protein n=1 Tax=Cyclostephanos tholiformis TaxID=382380 RepID=A0ABD3SNR3_9STRA